MKKKSKLRIRQKYILFILGFLVVIIFTMGFLFGFNQGKHKLENKFYSPNKYFEIPEIDNIPNNLTLHICSSECIYQTDTIKNKLNDSFIINNKLNNSNCNKCDSNLEPK
jgi:hypothetical protein